jgi:hypothetical protein
MIPVSAPAVLVPREFGLGIYYDGTHNLVAVDGETTFTKNGERFLKATKPPVVATDEAVIRQLTDYLQRAVDDSPESLAMAMMITGGKSIPTALLEHVSHIQSRYGGHSGWHKISSNPKAYWADVAMVLKTKMRLKEPTVVKEKTTNLSERIVDKVLASIGPSAVAAPKRDPTQPKRFSKAKKLSKAMSLSAGCLSTLDEKKVIEIMKSGVTRDCIVRGRDVMWQRHIAEEEDLPADPAAASTGVSRTVPPAAKGAGKATREVDSD